MSIRKSVPDLTVLLSHSYAQKYHFLISVQFPFKQIEQDRTWAFLSI
jgi:hypothetical protein